MDASVKRKPIIYFAGKIAKNGWRDDIVGCHAGRTTTAKDMDRLFDPTLTVDAGKFLYGGPFFVACDHGCAHGPGMHAAADGGCDGEEYDLFARRREIWEANRKRIERADFVFAYINETDCHGTLVEIGLAAALGKPAHVVFGRAVKLEDFDDMWMARVPSECFGDRPWYGNVGNPRESFDKFQKTLDWYWTADPDPAPTSAHQREVKLHSLKK